MWKGHIQGRKHDFNIAWTHVKKSLWSIIKQIVIYIFKKPIQLKTYGHI